MTGTTCQACACGTCASCSAAGAGTVPDRTFLFRHSQLRARMLGQIAAIEVGGGRPLAGLGTRASDEPSVALIDAQAACLHVLAWNAQRLGEDATITRSEDRDALVAMSRLLGYEPRPAISATTTLAFTLDDFPGSPGTATIPAGTKVASMPAQGELPQTFETDLAIEARAEWNALEPVQQLAPYAVDPGAASVWVQGVTIAVRPGDHLLYRTGTECNLGIVTAVERVPQKDRDRTRIDFTPLRKVDRAASVPAPGADDVVILGARAAPFGATAPDASLMPTDLGATNGAGEWNDFVIGVPGDPDHDRVDLDAVQADAVAGRLVVFVAQFLSASVVSTVGDPEMRDLASVGRIVSSEELSRADFGMAAKITRIKVDGIPLVLPDLVKPKVKAKKGIGDIEVYIGDVFDSHFAPHVRETTIYIETGRAELFHFVVDRALPGDLTALDVPGVVDLPAGRRVLLTGEAWAGTAGLSGPAAAEFAEIARTEAMSGFTRLHFTRPLARRYRSTTLTINANCAPASHGETLPGEAEIIGSGRATAASPRFTLARGPLAYVPADNPRGYAPALEVRVDDRRFDEVPMIYGQPATARTYAVRPIAGRSEVQFASRLPGGTYNVTARYRTGGGSAGLLGPGRLTSLVSPVLGVSGVINPLATEGGSDAAGIEALREAAPRWVRTLDRVVSLADYETFAGDYRGIGKAMASELHDGMRALVLLTVADTAMRPPPPGSQVMADLSGALAKAAVPGRKVRVQGFADYLAVLTIRLATDSALPRDKVEAGVRAALAERFGRAARRFGQGLHQSELLAAIQDVPGVRAATIASWQRARAEPFMLQTGAGETTRRLLCPGVALDQVAGLLSIDPAHVTFQELGA